MTDYESTIQYLYEQLPMFSVIGPGAYKPGLGTAHMLDDAFGNQHTRFKSIHVAGTNGKGSTSHSLASVLAEAGYKVGLYTSPHLADFRERIRVNGEMIPREYVVDFVERYRSMGLECSPSFFELTTIMAFCYFAHSGVDYAVIETGLGGRLDTTNIITPILSVITNISLDHTALLGDNECAIAREKAGIIKPGVPVVIGEAKGEVREVFEQAAELASSPIIFAEDEMVSNAVDGAGHLTYGYRPGQQPYIHSDLVGEYQVKNANTVMAALRTLGFVPIDAVERGMAHVQRNTGLMGRWTTLREQPLVVCDTGHNIGAWQYLAPQLSHCAAERELRVVIGFASDKDVEAIFKLLPRNATYYMVQPQVKRARPVESLMELAYANELQAQAFGTVREGYEKALADSREGDMVFVGGSNFVVAEIL